VGAWYIVNSVSFSTRRGAALWLWWTSLVAMYRPSLWDREAWTRVAANNGNTRDTRGELAEQRIGRLVQSGTRDRTI